MALGPMQIVMIAAGGLIALAGAWVLFTTRAQYRALRFAGEPEPVPKGMSLATRYAVALCAVITGYHLIFWAFPRSVSPVQLDRDRWWVWLIVLAIGLGLSFMVDRIERSRAEQGDADGDKSEG